MRVMLPQTTTDDTGNRARTSRQRCVRPPVGHGADIPSLHNVEIESLHNTGDGQDALTTLVRALARQAVVEQLQP